MCEHASPELFDSFCFKWNFRRLQKGCVLQMSSTALMCVSRTQTASCDSFFALASRGYGTGIDEHAAIVDVVPEGVTLSSKLNNLTRTGWLKANGSSLTVDNEVPVQAWRMPLELVLQMHCCCTPLLDASKPLDSM